MFQTEQIERLQSACQSEIMAGVSPVAHWSEPARLNEHIVLDMRHLVVILASGARGISSAVTEASSLLAFGLSRTHRGERHGFCIRVSA